MISSSLLKGAEPMSDQSENMKAINTYFVQTKAITPKAAAIQSDWAKWYGGLGFYDLNIDGSKYDEARARRNNFNLANVLNAAEQKKVEQVLAQGITSEMLSGKSDKEVAAAKARVAAMQTTLSVQGSTHGTIKQGSKGDSVKEWQKFLGLKTDGIFGPGTQKATMLWQTKNGLKADGIVGPQTWTLALGAKEPLHNDASVVAQIPAIFSPAPKTMPVTGAPKPTAAAVQAAQAAGPKPAVTVNSAGQVSGVKPAGESAMASMATASMIPGIPNAIKNMPTWAKAMGAVGIGILGWFGIKKTRELAADHADGRSRSKSGRPVYY